MKNIFFKYNKIVLFVFLFKNINCDIFLNNFGDPFEDIHRAALKMHEEINIAHEKMRKQIEEANSSAMKNISFSQSKNSNNIKFEFKRNDDGYIINLHVPSINKVDIKPIYKRSKNEKKVEKIYLEINKNDSKIEISIYENRFEFNSQLISNNFQSTNESQSTSSSSSSQRQSFPFNEKINLEDCNISFNESENLIIFKIGYYYEETPIK